MSSAHETKMQCNVLSENTVEPPLAFCNGYLSMTLNAENAKLLTWLYARTACGDLTLGVQSIKHSAISVFAQSSSASIFGWNSTCYQFCQNPLMFRCKWVERARGYVPIGAFR